MALFETLVEELEEGRGDVEGFVAAHPSHGEELRALHRGWQRARALFSELVEDGSLMRSVRRELSAGVAAERVDGVMARLGQQRFAERYAVGDVLGQGGMGLVLSVTDRHLGRELAMKVVRAVEPERRALFLARFLEEAEVIARLEHPGIVPIHELGLDAEGQVYFTMPLVRGRTLEELLALARRGAEGWSLVRVVGVLVRACEAVAYAHSRGVLHRDLKPANVMVGRFGEVFVLDWGLARSLGSGADALGNNVNAPGTGALTLAGEIVGTPAYMAPEQALGDSRALDQRADVYALGAILYEALTGTRPYGERSSAQALAELERAPPPPVGSLAPDANEELVAIVARAMARGREQRYASVEAFAGDLGAFLEGRVVGAHARGPWAELRKWVARNRGLAGALGLALVVLVAGLSSGLYLWQKREAERANVFRLSRGATLANLVERARQLWPVHPARIGELCAWRDEARELLRTLEPDPARGDDGLRAQLARLEARRAEWSDEDRWWHTELTKLVRGIEGLADPEHGLLGEGLGEDGWGIGARMARAERLERESAREDVRAAWDEARAELRADARFAGVELAPIVGLVPLGADPDSGLQEFAHLLTGAVPRRGVDGKLALDEASGLVLVLVPGGESLLGSQSDDPNGPNFVPEPTTNGKPVQRVTLRPCLLSKFEMTRAQWERASGRDPSFHREHLEDRRLPVEQVSWHMAQEELAHVGLRLPSEDEWEHGTRAGTTTTFFWGNDRTLFPRYANVRDAALQEAMQTQDPYEPENDGQAGIAPVGSFAPNAWGLHDVVGNVFEWCEDLQFPLGQPEGVKVEEPDSRVFRSGSYQRPLRDCHSARRGGESPGYVYRSVGVRPALSLPE